MAAARCGSTLHFPHQDLTERPAMTSTATLNYPPPTTAPVQKPAGRTGAMIGGGLLATAGAVLALGGGGILALGGSDGKLTTGHEDVSTTTHADGSQTTTEQQQRNDSPPAV